MHIAAYIRPQGLVDPTGVGKHQIYMVRELAKCSGVDVTIIAPEDTLTNGKLPGNTDLNDLPLISIPFKRRFLDFIWSFIDWPCVDRWLPDDIDWVYCPFEVCIPTKKAKFAATIHCSDWFEKDLPWYNDSLTKKTRRRMMPVFKRVLNKADLTLTVSVFLKERLCVLFGSDPDRILVVGNGVESEYFDVKPRSCVQNESEDMAPYVLVIGSLREGKGAKYIFSVADKLLNMGSNIVIKVASGKTSPDRYMKEAKKHPNIELLDYADVSALKELLAGAVALLFLSRSESFGIPAIEAMAAGVPVLTSSFGALPEVVGDAGFVFDVEQDHEQVAETIVTLVNDIEMRNKYSVLGKERASKFLWCQCAAKLVSAFSSKED
ncbi:MAG: glycosyltransferase family 4 protein [Kiritimatiellae bacterium]|nr:glycosyltransferase family 4 protein [Kiritimatiellia bacterium]